jgi:hypothetical protein
LTALVTLLGLVAVPMVVVPLVLDTTDAVDVVAALVFGGGVTTGELTASSFGKINGNQNHTATNPSNARMLACLGFRFSSRCSCLLNFSSDTASTDVVARLGVNRLLGYRLPEKVT